MWDNILRFDEGYTAFVMLDASIARVALTQPQMQNSQVSNASVTSKEQESLAGARQ